MTKIVTIALAGLIAIVDLALIGSDRMSISQFLYTSSREYPVIALVAGLLAGHIFWPVQVQHDRTYSTKN